MAGRKTTEGMAKPTAKVALLPALISSLFTTLAMACANTTTFMTTKPTSAFFLVPDWKTVVTPLRQTQ
jgi:hypothetical protein